MGSLALTGQPSKQAPFAPLPGEVTHVPYGDVDALAAAVTDETAAVFLEPIMGEGGVVTPPAGYLVAARELTARHGALLVLDEVQTGIGRTGTFYAHQHDGITPDLVTLAKGLGGGLPIGACLAIGDAAELLTPGLHGSTFGGNPVCTAAALAVLKTLADDDLIARADALGKTLSHGIEAIGHPLVDHVRGRGLLRGIVLTAPHGKAVETAARDAGFLVNAATPDVIRLAPPLVVTDAQVDAFLTALPGSSRYGHSGGSCDMTLRHFLRDDDLTPTEQAEVLALAPRTQEGAVQPQAAGGATWRRGHLREELDADPVLVRDGHRAARRTRRSGRRAQHSTGPRRDPGGHRPGAVALRRRDRVADVRAGAVGRHGIRIDGADRQRPVRRVPPLPGAGRPADAGRTQGHVDRPADGVLRRRRQQHGALADAGRGNRGNQRDHRRPSRFRTASDVRRGGAAAEPTTPGPPSPSPPIRERPPTAPTSS